MQALPGSAPWDVPAQLAGVALQSRGVHSEGAWTPVDMGIQDLNPTALSTESAFGVEGQWIWVDDHCDVDSLAATLCPGEGVEWMGELIDTPGIRTFGLHGVTKQSLATHFPDFDVVEHRCHFHNCTHQHEPKCAVIAMVESGTIASHRYQAYLNLIESVEDTS